MWLSYLLVFWISIWSLWWQVSSVSSFELGDEDFEEAIVI
jgi:hypothetical protein